MSESAIEAKRKVGDAVHELALAMRKMPQADGLITNHYFTDGMYARALFVPAGTLIVGKMHKKEHFFIVASGKIAVTDGSGAAVEYGAGAVFVSKPETQRAGLAIEDSWCINVHRTDKIDLDEIEKELVVDDGLALFDARNELKAINVAEESKCLG